MERLNAWLEKNGFIGAKTEENDVFAYDVETKTIFVGKNVEDGTDFFPEFLETYGCDYATDVPLPMLAFLHELGHFNTIHAYSPTELVLCNMMKKPDKRLSVREQAFNYWLVPDEMEANAWEIEYLMNEDNFPALNELYEIIEEIYA